MTIEPIELPNGRKIGPGEPCFVVAEIGQNHNGDVYTALRLLKAAHDAGVDAVKFCKRHIPSDLARVAYEQPYDNPHSFGATYGEHREALELSIEEYVHLRDRMVFNEWPEVFFSTACDITSANELKTHVNPPMYKIASRDIDNLPLIEHVASFGKPVILSTGMASPYGCPVARAVETVQQHDCAAIVLYCISEYPTPIEHINLGAMENMRSMHGCMIGFSDHTAGIVASQAAATLGAVMVEKHVTLARAMKGTDHAGSLEPQGIARLAQNIRATEEMRQPVHSDQARDVACGIAATRGKLGRSLVATRHVAKGEIVTPDMVTPKSPGTGLRWSQRYLVFGIPAWEEVPKDELFRLKGSIAVAARKVA